MNKKTTKDSANKAHLKSLSFPGFSQAQVIVAARKHKRSGLQTRKFLAHISCKSDWTSAHINCKQTHYYLQRACNHPTWLKLIANKPNADEEVGMLVCKVSS